MGKISLRFLLCFLGLFCTLSHATPATQPTDAKQQLLDHYQLLSPKLKSSPFNQPIVLESNETNNTIQGDIYAELNYPFDLIRQNLNDPKLGAKQWCAVLMLHLNTKYCNTGLKDNKPIITLGLGNKNTDINDSNYEITFNYQSENATADYFNANLSADSGPLGTHDYHMAIQVAKLNNNTSVMHLTYQYAFSAAAKIAMKTYLATIGRNKVGFTKLNNDQVSDSKNERNQYIKGVRGVVERNTMRYYLAIGAYLKSLSLPSEQQAQQRFILWFDATEEYPIQLHEIERDEYLLMKGKQQKLLN